MNEVEFRNWLVNKGFSKKIAADAVSRLKRIEKEIENCDIDEQYRSDRCNHLLGLLCDMGNKKEVKKYSNVNLPVGKYYMSTYRYSIRQYIQFLDEVSF